MVTDHPVSTEAGPQPRPNTEPKSSLDSQTAHSEIGLQVAAPALVTDDQTSKQSNPGTSVASHLEGLSPAEIKVIEDKFQHLLETVHSNRPGDDLEVIRNAWEFSLQQHEGQKRASGEPYIIHPLEVGQVLAELKMDSTAIAAGLLHDAVEDTNVTTAEIAQRFGDHLANIVEGVTKLDKIKFA
ncbi:MAG TPA: HD domain-containing protein, partial [Edaphobacter sp.]|nr:HD domain-containing protein [Edaphobacter sp.]